MARACEKCGAPAADDQSQFCNRCGGPVQDLPDKAFPACRKCGFPAPDAKSEFCTRCGTKFTEEPQAKFPVCRNCGHEIPDEQAGFCNRCGAPSRGPGAAGAAQTKVQAPQPVVVARKKHEVTPETAADWTPFSDADEKAGSVSALLDKKKRSKLPVGPQTPVDTIGNGSGSGHSKKYAHLPLVADEMKGLKPVMESPPPDAGGKGPGRKDPAGKKGIMNFFKKKN
jgi:ribosomal protein L37E